MFEKISRISTRVISDDAEEAAKQIYDVLLKHPSKSIDAYELGSKLGVTPDSDYRDVENFNAGFNLLEQRGIVGWRSENHYADTIFLL